MGAAYGGIACDYNEQIMCITEKSVQHREETLLTFHVEHPL